MLRVTQSDLPSRGLSFHLAHPRMSLETSSSKAMAIGRGGKFNRISLLSYFLLLCVLLLSLLSRSRVPTMGFHSPIQRLLRRSISAQRKSDLRAHFSSSGGDWGLARCCHDTRMESVNAATGSYWAGGHISIDKSAIYSTFDRPIDGQLIHMAAKLLKTERCDITKHCSRLSSQNRHYSRRGLEIAALATQSLGPP